MANNESFDAAFDQLVPQPMYHASPDGIITRVNRALTELTGYKTDELVGQPTSLLFANKEDPISIEEEAIRTGRVKARGLTALTKDKKEVPVIISTFVTKNSEGQVTGYAAVLNETTENKIIQQKIEQAAREWRATLDAINDLVWIADKDCRLLKVNRAFAGSVGMEPKQLIGKTCSSVFSWSTVMCSHCPHKNTIVTKESATQEFYRPETNSYLEVSTSPILNEESQAIASVCVARNITNRKLAEKQIESLNRLRQYFSPNIAQKLISDEDMLKVRRKNMTIFFTDIRGFTRLSDEVEPEELVHMLNEYFSSMTQVAFKWGATIDKFIGDSVMGFFGDPEECPNQAELAVKMALEMQARIKEINEKSLLWCDSILAVGIGINTGYVTIGNIGSETRKDYTVIGRHVNLAARLQEEAKAGQILISQRTYKEIAKIVKTEEVGLITVKGFDKPVVAYNVIGLV